MRKFVLIYPSGAGNAIEIYYSIKDSIHINVIPASGKVDISDLVYENEVEYIPYIQSTNFIEELNKLIETKNIDFIFPTHDTVALHLVENSDAINSQIISSDHKTNYISRYKRETYNVFEEYDFCPEVYNEILNEKAYPIFSKPNVGEGSKGVKLIKNSKEHLDLKKAENDLIFVEYLPGKEFTIDCFTNRKGELQFVGPRERVEIMMGVSFRSKEVKDKGKFIEIANNINDKLQFRGVWFFQLKEDINGKLKLLEVSTRTPGTIGFFRHLGANLPLLSIFDAMELDVNVKMNNFNVELFRSTKNRYKYSFDFKRVYLDFDDTLIINNKVNIDVISFVYQCKNLNKEVYLITKHEFDLNETLNRHNISEYLFDKIILLKPEDKKSDFIDPEAAIFIDNWFKEREEVKNSLNIPVFDVDTVNSLIIQ